MQCVRQYAMYDVQCAMCNVQCAMCNVQCVGQCVRQCAACWTSLSVSPPPHHSPPRTTTLCGQTSSYTVLSTYPPIHPHPKQTHFLDAIAVYPRQGPHLSIRIVIWILPSWTGRGQCYLVYPCEWVGQSVSQSVQ